ncbi:MAG: BASS family bile acid:Na+ symporter [Cryomorphaceae bacterium]
MTQDINDFQLELGQSSEIGMAIALALMMFSVALGLRMEHFSFIREAPRVFVAGLIGQLFLLPLLTLFLVFVLQPIPSVALGMILIACCPGGNVSNMLVLLARGNTALSVSLTASSSFAAAFVTPISIVFWSSLYPPTAELLTSIQFDVLSFLIQTSVILVLPLALGMFCVHYFERFSAMIRRPLVTVSSILLLVIIVTATIKYWAVFVVLGAGLVGIVAVHNALAFIVGNSVARIAKADVPSRRALTFEVGIQNSGLGIVILLTQMGGLGGAAAVAGLWGSWHIIAGLVLVAAFRFSDRRVKNM